jgi:hypothetical protein
MKNLLQVQKAILSLTDIREILALIGSLCHQKRRIEKYLALHFNNGDRVSFISRYHGRLTGKVIGVNNVTVVIMLDKEFSHSDYDDADISMMWKIKPSELRFLVKPENPSFNPFEIPPPIMDNGSLVETYENYEVAESVD